MRATDRDPIYSMYPLLFKPDENRRKTYKAQIRKGIFVITCSDPPVRFQLEKIFLDQMSFFITPPVTMSFVFCLFSGWDRRFSAIFIDIIDELVAIISTSTQNMASFYSDMIQQRDRKIDIIALPFAQHKINWISIRIYYCMNL